MEAGKTSRELLTRWRSRLMSRQGPSMVVKRQSSATSGTRISRTIVRADAFIGSTRVCSL